MDRDSPIEWTGEAHLVTVTCPACDEGHSVPEGTAEVMEGGVVCPDCSEAMDDLWSDLYIREPVRRLRLMADYIEAEGFYTKANCIRHLADELELYESLIRAMDKYRGGDIKRDRLSLERKIQQYDEAKA